ncbi:MAG: hypothetical protein EOO15_16445 [Chitinophagaceae bacterium]|nr:MAG: hypothetical protein EOO15_16445 [Chitinophagaceae bacterium]
MKFLSIRSISVAAATVAMAASANALTLDWTKTVGTSTMAFSDAAVALLKTNGTTVTALGNTTTVTAGKVFSLPITSITINGSLKIAAGSASGSALNMKRTTFDENDNAIVSGLVLANFTLDYVNNKVLADLTPKGGTTTPQSTVFAFHVATPLALKYKFPLSITGHEVLDQLFVTPEALTIIASGLGLQGEDILNLVRNTDFGTLTQDIAVKSRPAVNKTPYVPAP